MNEVVQLSSDRGHEFYHYFMMGHYIQEIAEMYDTPAVIVEKLIKREIVTRGIPTNEPTPPDTVA